MEKTHLISDSLLDKIIEYIKESEVTIEGEFGSGRNFEELVKDGDLTPLYFVLKSMKDRAN